MTDWLPKCDSLSFDKAKRMASGNVKIFIFIYVCVVGSMIVLVFLSVCTTSVQVSSETKKGYHFG